VRLAVINEPLGDEFALAKPQKEIPLMEAGIAHVNVI
jgi:hypothetical protein